MNKTISSVIFNLSNFRVNALSLFLSMLILFGIISSSRAQQTTDELLNSLNGKKHWFGIYIAEHKVGYAYDSWKISIEDETPVLISDRFFSYNLVEIDASYKETAIFKLEGSQNLISLHTIDKATFYDDDGKEIDTKEVINRVTKKESDYHISKIEKGSQSVKIVNYFPIELKKYWFDVFALDEEFVKSLGGKKFVSGFDLDRGKPDYSIISDIKNRKILTEGNLVTKKTVLATQSVDTSWEAAIQLEYIDSKQTRLDMLGNWVLILQDKKEAMASGKTLKLKDLDFFPLEEKIDVDNLTQLKLEINGIGVEQMVQNNARQKILSSKNDQVQILLKKNFSEPKDQEKNLSLYLESTEMIPLNLSELEAINPIKDKNISAIKKAKTLNEFVHNYIEYSVRPEGPTLKEIIVEQKGDCSEYASLLTALSRLNGLPAREVGGYAYTEENDSPSFGAHAWVEIYIDGRWQEFDPTWNEEKLGIEHILFNEGFLVGGSIEVIN